MEYFITSENLIKEIKGFYEDHQSFFDSNKGCLDKLFTVDVRFVTDERGMYVKTALKANEDVLKGLSPKMQKHLGNMPIGYTVVDMI